MPATLEEMTAKVEALTASNAALEQKIGSVSSPAAGTAGVSNMLHNQQAPAYAKAVGHQPLSFTRFLIATANSNPSLAPREYQMVDLYRKALTETNCTLQHTLGTSGVWWPANINETYGGRLTETDSAAKDYREVKSMMEASRPGYDPDEARWLQDRGVVAKSFDAQGYYTKTQSAYVDSLGGTLVAPPIQGAPIPLIRPQAAFLAAGAQAITLPPNGRWVAPRITSPPSANAVGESQDTLVSNLGTDQMELTAKKIAGAVILTEEGTAFTSGTLDAIAQGELGRTLGLQLDAYAFYGQGGTQIPAGLTSNVYSSLIINIQTSYPTAKGIGPNGNTLLPQYGDFFPALIAERSFNVDATTGAWVLRPSAYSTAVGLRGDAVAAGDQAGPMVDILRRFGETGPNQWRGRRVVQSTNINGTGTKGSGTALSDVFFGIWQYAMFASYGAIQFQQGHNANTFLRGQIIVRGTMFGDIGFQYPPAFLWFQSVQGMSNNF